MTGRILLFAVVTAAVGLFAFTGAAGSLAILAKAVFFLFLLILLFMLIGKAAWRKPPRY